jgi:hypothetical protein
MPEAIMFPTTNAVLVQMPILAEGLGLAISIQ